MNLPRFQGDSYNTNKYIAQKLTEIAEDIGCTLAQLSLAWVMAQGGNIIPIPGTTKIKNLDSNIEAVRIKLHPKALERIVEVLDSHTVKGERYTSEGMKGVNG
jgi:aryl-alcohol dehydrogenase-like predicted oxidoreductase